nr:hypothetical protein [Enterobacter sp. JBIWA003]
MLQDFTHLVSRKKPSVLIHIYISQIALEGHGSLDGTVVKFSPELNTLTGILGRGRSYVLDIPFGEKASDSDYKETRVSNFFKSGIKLPLTPFADTGRPIRQRVYAAARNHHHFQLTITANIY